MDPVRGDVVQRHPRSLWVGPGYSQGPLGHPFPWLLPRSYGPIRAWNSRYLHHRKSPGRTIIFRDHGPVVAGSQRRHCALESGRPFSVGAFFRPSYAFRDQERRAPFGARGLCLARQLHPWDGVPTCQHDGCEQARQEQRQCRRQPRTLHKFTESKHETSPAARLLSTKEGFTKGGDYDSNLTKE